MMAVARVSRTARILLFMSRGLASDTVGWPAIAMYHTSNRSPKLWNIGRFASNMSPSSNNPQSFVCRQLAIMLRSVRTAAFGAPSLPLVKTRVPSFAGLPENSFSPKAERISSGPGAALSRQKPRRARGTDARISAASRTLPVHGNDGFAFEIFSLYGDADTMREIPAVSTQLFAATGPSVKLRFTGTAPASRQA